MELKITRTSLQIFPDHDMHDERDIAFIEEVLGLKENGDTVPCKRVNAMGLDCIAYLEIEKRK